jgi:1,4-dihydroxy-2-naphthoate octaprenyltransferase
VTWLLAAARPRTLLASIGPVGVGAAWAASQGALAPARTLAAWAGLVCLQVGANLMNDAEDFARGADGPGRLGPARACASGAASVSAVRRAAWGAFAAAGCAGAYLALQAGWLVVVLGLLGVAVAALYTAGPKPLAYLGLGELAVFVCFGPAAVLGTHLILGAALDAGVLLASAVTGLASAAVLVVNNLRDRELDAAAGKRTLAVRLGGAGTRRLYVGLAIGAFGSVAAAAAVSGRPAICMGLAGVPLAAWCARGIWRDEGAALNPWLGRTLLWGLTAALLVAMGVLV